MCPVPTGEACPLGSHWHSKCETEKRRWPGTLATLVITEATGASSAPPSASITIGVPASAHPSQPVPSTLCPRPTSFREARGPQVKKGPPSPIFPLGTQIYQGWVSLGTLPPDTAGGDHGPTGQDSADTVLMTPSTASSCDSDDHEACSLWARNGLEMVDSRTQSSAGLTLLAGFGVLDVGHRLGAQGPDGDPQL